MTLYKYSYALFFIFLFACNPDKKENILSQEKTNNAIPINYTTDTLDREAMQGIWIRKDYLEAIKTEKSPLKAYQKFGDFFLIRIYTYDYDFCLDKQYPEARLLEKEEIDQVVIEYEKKYKNNQEVEVELLGDFNDQETPVELSIFLDAIDEKGYKVYSRYFNKGYWGDTTKFKTPREYIKFVPNKGILNLSFSNGEKYKDSLAKTLTCHIKFKKSELTFSIYQDSSFWEYKFVKVGPESYKSYPTFKLIPEVVINLMMQGSYNLYDRNGKLVAEDIVLKQNGDILNWKLYQHFELTLAFSDVDEWGRNTDLMYMFKEHPDEVAEGTYNRNNRVDYIMEREGGIIRLYHTDYEQMERIAYYKKSSLAYELRPVYKNLSVVPI